MVRFFDIDFYGPNVLKEEENKFIFKDIAELSDTEYIKPNFP